MGEREDRETRRGALARALRVLVLTDRALASPRAVPEVVEEVLQAGVRAIQLRDKQASSRDLYQQARALLEITRRHDALLFVNDRLDVAVAAGADGAHLGPDDLSIASARRWVPASLMLGYSTDDPIEARRAVADGADYIGCGAVFGTTSKDVGGEQIGLDRLRAVVEAVPVPVVAIGGIDTSNAASVPATGAAGVAVLSAVMAAEQPAREATQLVEAMRVPGSAHRSDLRQ